MLVIIMVVDAYFDSNLYIWRLCRPQQTNLNIMIVYAAVWLKCRLASPAPALASRRVCARLSPSMAALNTPAASDRELQQARLALARWKRDGTSVCPDTQTHIEAYLLVRKASVRPRLDRVLAAIQSASINYDHGATVSSKFYLVRKADFPTGVPEKLERHLVTVADIQERFDCGDTNLDGLLVFHKTASVADLPVWSSKVTFYQRTNTLMKHKRSFEDCGKACALDDSGQARALDSGSAEAETSAAQATLEPLTAGPAETRRPPSPPVSAKEKRRRILKQYDSSEREEDEEQMISTHGHLIKNCEKAIEDGNFSGKCKSLHFWATQVLHSIEPAAPAPEARPGMQKDDAMMQLLKDTFGCFLVKSILGAKCFDSLPALAPLLKELAAVGVKMPKVHDVVHNLERADLADPHFAEETICKTGSNRMLGLETRLTVFACKLYTDFLEKRTRALLRAAKKARGGASRMELLSAAKACHQVESGAVSAEVVSEVDAAVSIFGARATQALALDYVLDNSTGISLGAGIRCVRRRPLVGRSAPAEGSGCARGRP